MRKINRAHRSGEDLTATETTTGEVLADVVIGPAAIYPSAQSRRRARLA